MGRQAADTAAGDPSGPVAFAPGPFAFVAPNRRNDVMKTALTLAVRKPRNPLVAAAHLRLAGRHQRSGSSARQQASRAVQRELRQLHSP